MSPLHTCAECAHSPTNATRRRERVFDCAASGAARHLDAPRRCEKFDRPLIDLNATHAARQKAEHP